MRNKIGVLASGSGSTFQALQEAIVAGKLPNTEIATVVCNNGSESGNAQVWQRARKLGVDIVHISNKTQKSCTVPTVGGVEVEGTISYEASDELRKLADEEGIVMYVGLGFMKKIIGSVLEEIPIANSHPGPLPATAGEFGDGVQQKVMQLWLPRSGPTLHWMDQEVDENGIPMYDSGPVIGHEPVEISDYMRWQWLSSRSVKTLKDEVMRVEKEMVPGWIGLALEQVNATV